MFGWLRRKSRAGIPAPGELGQVKVFLNPLIMLLAGAERQRGRPLTRDEVVSIRDSAAHVMMTPEQAKVFYESMDGRMPIHRLNPDRAWEEWQEIRDQVRLD